MTSGLFTAPGQDQVLETDLNLPYTLTTGHAAGTFLTALAQRKLIGSRDADGKISVPPRDVSGTAALDARPQYVEVAQTGTISSWTELSGERGGIVALIRLDGTDVDLLHRIIGGDGPIAAGTRVRVVWAEQPTQSILDLAGFVVDSGAESDTTPPRDFDPATLEEPIHELKYKLSLHYRHAYGPYYGQLFDNLGTHRRILGSAHENSPDVLVPPRALSEINLAKAERLVDVQDTGRLQAFSVIHLEFIGQTRKPPYVYAEIVLDGSATRLIHTVGGIDVSKANELLKIGSRVKAVWRDPEDCIGTLDDISHFELIPDED